MYRILGLLIFSLASILASCTREKNNMKEIKEIIEINPNEAKDKIYLSELVDSLMYIKLQTDPNCIIGRITKIYIKEKFIYIVDATQQVVFVFDKQGKFVSKLDKLGKGPDEYLHINHVFVENDEKFVEIIGSRGKDIKLLKYSNIKFELLDDNERMPKVSSNSCRREGDTYYYATQQIDNIVFNKSTNASILVSKNGEIVKELFRKKIVTNNSYFSFNSECFTLNDKNELFVSNMYDNTFYQLSNMNAYPIITIDFGNHGIDNSIGLKSTNEQLEYLKTCRNKAFFPVLDINNSNILVFTYLFKDDLIDSGPYHFIKLKKTNKVFHTKRIINDLTSFPSEVVICTYNNLGYEAWYKDYLVEIVLPGYELKDDSGNIGKFVEGVGLIKSTDNPIIILMRLK